FREVYCGNDHEVTATKNVREEYDPVDNYIGTTTAICPRRLASTTSTNALITSRLSRRLRSRRLCCLHATTTTQIIKQNTTAATVTVVRDLLQQPQSTRSAH
ncbi:hypothetical protein AaE_011814, partial [Aphanomyces astaci]